MELQDMNRWWADGTVRKDLALELKRDIVTVISGDLPRKQMQVVVGLRRTGKSTIVYQIINQLIEGGTPPRHILYCSFDEPDMQPKRIEDILKDYAKITGIDYRNEPVYIFLDEVQKSREWVASTKLVYDNMKNIRKIMVTGSASLNILSDAKKSLAGRYIYYEVKPLGFGEFLRFRGMAIAREDVLLRRETLEIEFERFKTRQFPEIIDEQSADFIKGYIRSAIIDPIIIRDMPREFDDVDMILIEKLVGRFLSDPGEYLDINGLAREMGRAKATLYKALFYLEFSFLIRRVRNYRPSVGLASRKLSKVYPYHPTLGLPFGVKDDRYAEGLVLSTLGAEYYWRDKEKEIDFLKDGVPVEVKYSSSIRRDDMKWIWYFEKKYGAKSGNPVIVTKDFEGEAGSIRLVPIWKFCFLSL